MKFIVDSADLGVIRDCYEHLVCDGVTTNPSILAKSGIAPYEVLGKIRAFLGKDADLHVQVISGDCETMLKEAEAIAGALGKNTYIKVLRQPRSTPRRRHILRDRQGRITSLRMLTAFMIPARTAWK